MPARPAIAVAARTSARRPGEQPSL